MKKVWKIKKKKYENILKTFIVLVLYEVSMLSLEQPHGRTYNKTKQCKND